MRGTRDAPRDGERAPESAGLPNGGLRPAACYRPRVNWTRRDAPVIAALTPLVAEKSRWGFWKCYDRLRIGRQPWNQQDASDAYAYKEVYQIAHRFQPGAMMGVNEIEEVCNMEAAILQFREALGVRLDVVDIANRVGLMLSRRG